MYRTPVNSIIDLSTILEDESKLSIDESRLPNDESNETADFLLPTNDQTKLYSNGQLNLVCVCAFQSLKVLT